MIVNKSHFFKACLLAAITLISPLANALQMEPLSMVLRPSGPNANKVFRIINESSKPIAVQLSMTTRKQVGNKEVRLPADDKFMIYPPQTIIPAKSAQKVRIQWLGDSQIKDEQAYRLIAEQVYVSLQKEQTGVNMLMRLEGALYVQPSKTKSQVKVTQLKPEGNKRGVTVANVGNRHQLLNKATLNLKHGNQLISLKGKQLLGLEGKNVLGKSTFKFLINKPEQFRNAAWVASLNLKK